MKFKRYFNTDLTGIISLYLFLCNRVKFFAFFITIQVLLNSYILVFTSDSIAATPSIPACSSITDHAALSSTEEAGVGCYMLCSALPDSVAANPGRNCLIRNLPTCGEANSVHRVNCYDPIDLPVCSVIDSSSDRKNLKNCIYQCDNSRFTDNSIAPVHNQNCIRFCSDTETTNCVNRKCHQYQTSSYPGADFPSSCAGNSLVKCNKLWPNEHRDWLRFMMDADGVNNQRFHINPVNTGIPAPLYCDNKASNAPNDFLKCHIFNESSMRFLNTALSNFPCKTHDCMPSDDWTAIGDRSDSFKSTYNTWISKIFINGTTNMFSSSSDPGYPGGCSAPPAVEQTIYNENIPCSAHSAYEDFDASASERIYPSSRCDTTGDGSRCSAVTPGFCYRSVDCSENPTDNSCPPPRSPDPPASDISSLTSFTEDSYSSWFHRPSPSSKSTYTDSEGRKLISNNVDDNDLCIPTSWRSAGTQPGQSSFDEDDHRGRYGKITWPFGMGTWHFFYYDLFEDSISPGLCRWKDGGGSGGRGIGYIYLKGARGLLYNNVDLDTMYYKSAVSTTFNGEVANHRVTICSRFRNALCVQCEGFRECVPTVSSATVSGTWTQICGRDYCETFDIAIDPEELDTRKRRGHSCMFDEGNDSNMGEGCHKSFDGYLRMRAVFHEGRDTDYVCGYLDAKGHLGYNPEYIRPSNAHEHIEKDDTSTPCRAKSGVDAVETDPGSGNFVYDCSEGFDEGSRTYDKGLAHKWRNVLKAPFILNNQEGGPMAGMGYYDAKDKFHYKVPCAPVLRRVGSIFYNVATPTNSPTILNPPIYISSVISNDFYRPEIRVHYGLRPISTFGDSDPAPDYSCYDNPDNPAVSDCMVNSRNPSSSLDGHNQVFLSLAPLEIDGDSVFQEHVATNPSDKRAGGRLGEAPAYTYIDSEVPAVSERLVTEIFLRKSYNFSSGDPEFCLYQKTKDANGEYSDNPFKIDCRQRSYPRGTVTFNYSNFTNQVHINGVDPIDGSRFNTRSTDINLRTINKNYCSTEIGRYYFCMRRGICTKLAIECPNAAVERSAAVSRSESSSSYDGIVHNCNSVIRPECLRTRGLDPLSTSPYIDIAKTNDYGAFRCVNSDSSYLEGVVFDSNDPTSDYDIRECEERDDPFRYGWHSETYVSQGFSHFFTGKVLAHKTRDGSMGICKMNESSSNLNDYLEDSSGNRVVVSGRYVKDRSTHCLGGGTIYSSAPCRCVTFPENANLRSLGIDTNKFYLRDPTPREVGLSMNVPFVDVCAGVLGAQQANANGEDFPSVNVGAASVGTCDINNGWVERRDLAANPLYPQIMCVSDSSEDAVPGFGVFDDSSLRNTCIRRDCNQIVGGNPSNALDYLNDYDAGEAGECKGYRHGFANWSQYTPDPDVDPSTYIATASSCLPGFKPFGSSSITDAATGAIIGYSGGVLPERICQLNGLFGALTDASKDETDNSCGPTPATTRDKGCVRISCPPSVPPQPTSQSDYTALVQWVNNQGASFGSTVLASRSATQNYLSSRSIGICNNRLGYFSIPGMGQPYYECDYLGNKTEIQNPCMTQLSCIQVDDSTDSEIMEYHGFALWDEITDETMLPITQSAAARSAPALGVGYQNAEFNSNLDARHSSDQERLRFSHCISGYTPNPYPPLFDISNNPLPDIVKNDLTRPAESPKRRCLGIISGRGDLVTRWQEASNPCVNKCPGAINSEGMDINQVRAEIDVLDGTTSRSNNEEARLLSLQSDAMRLDNRLTVGRTSHTKINSRGEIEGVEVKWPAANLGEAVYFSNHVPNSNNDPDGIGLGLNASSFEEGSSRDVFLLKRVCGEDGRWQDPVPSCAANGGLINSIDFRVPGVPNGYQNSVQSYTEAQSVAQRSSSGSDSSFESVAGQCNLNRVIPDRNERGRIQDIVDSLPNSNPVMYCKRNSSHINDVYYALHDPSSTFCNTCQQILPAVEISAGDPENLIAVTEGRRYFPGEIVNASCNANNNFYLTSTSSGPSEGPTLVCDKDKGSGNWIPQDAQNCKRSCELTSLQMLRRDLSTGNVCRSDVVYQMTGDVFGSGSVQVKHGQIFEFNAFNSCRLSYEVDFGNGDPSRSICKTWRYSARCDDKNWIISEDIKTGYNGCKYFEMNHTTNRWNDRIRMPLSSNPQFVTYMHLERMPGFFTGLGVLNVSDSLTNVSVQCSRGCPSSNVRARGLLPGAVAKGLEQSGGAAFNWDDVDVDDESLYSSTVGVMRNPNCFDYVYNGTGNVNDFDTSSCDADGCVPGTVIAGTCRPNSIPELTPLPSITCSPSGLWTISNDNNCITKEFNYGLLAGRSTSQVMNDGISNGRYDNSGGIVLESFDASAVNNGDPVRGYPIHHNTNPPTVSDANNLIQTRAFSTPSGHRALVIVDFDSIDNDFDIRINGTRIYGTDGTVGSIDATSASFPGHADSGDTYLKVSSPWSRNNNIDPSDPTKQNLPRIRVMIYNGQVEFYITRSNIDRSLTRILPTINDFNASVIGPGNHEIEIINLDGPGPDGMSGSIDIYQMPN